MSTSFSDLDEQRKKIAYERAQQRVRELRSTAQEELLEIQQEVQRKNSLTSITSSVPPIFLPIFKPSRYKGAFGGRGSAKSWSFAAAALKRCLELRGTRMVCVREVQKSLEQSVKRLLEDLIQKHNVGPSFRVLNTHIETPGNGIIIFQGMQNHTSESIKSLEGYDVAWVEEAQSLSKNSLELLTPTIRKDGSEIWFTWNPKHKTDPVDEMFRGGELPPDSLLIEATYKDNPFLPEVLRTEIEWDKRRDVEKYNHIWLGGYERHSESRVFKNWRVEDFTTPPDASFLFGGDWGFATDPTVGVRCFILGRTLYIDREVYKIGCEIDHTPSLFDGLKDDLADPREWEMLTDSVRPETISYMQRHGYPRVTGAKKGQGSVEEGVEFLKSYDIVIHTRCVHTADEFTSYSYKTHPLTGEIIPVLEDKKNHVIDATRYAVEKVRTPQGKRVEVW